MSWTSGSTCHCLFWIAHWDKVPLDVVQRGHCGASYKSRWHWNRLQCWLKAQCVRTSFLFIFLVLTRPKLKRRLLHYILFITEKETPYMPLWHLPPSCYPYSAVFWLTFFSGPGGRDKVMTLSLKSLNGTSIFIFLWSPYTRISGWWDNFQDF